MESFIIWLLIVVSLVSGCASIDLLERYQDTGPATVLPQTSYHTDVVAHDGTVIRATVFQPALEPGVEAPIIIHTHGFGAFRAPRRFSVYGRLVLSGQAAMAAWDSGYWMSSYDQRGFGDSEGKVQLMDPDYEVWDFISVLDWADEYLPRVRRAPDGDPIAPPARVSRPMRCSSRVCVMCCFPLTTVWPTGTAPAKPDRMLIW